MKGKLISSLSVLLCIVVGVTHTKVFSADVQDVIEPEVQEVQIVTPTVTPTPTEVPEPEITKNKWVTYYNQCFVPVYLDNVEVSAVVMDLEYIGDYYITAYCPEECGYRVYSDGTDNFPNGWITSTGTICHREEEWYVPSTCGINTKYLNYGDVLYIDGKVYVAEDTGYVTMPLIDLFMPSYEMMMTHGSHWTDVYKVDYVQTEPTKGEHFDIHDYEKIPYIIGNLI